MSKVGTRTKLIILIAVIVVLVVCIVFAVNRGGANDAGAGDASATTEQVQDQGLVVEDSATVQVELSDEEKAAQEAQE